MQTYGFRVTAINVIGLGAASDPVHIIAAGLSSAPQNLIRNELETNQTQVSISWEAPANDGGSPIIHYYIYWDLGNGDGNYELLWNEPVT